MISVSHLQGRGATAAQLGALQYGGAFKPYQKKQAQHTRPVKSVAPSRGPPRGGLPTPTGLISAV